MVGGQNPLGQNPLGLNPLGQTPPHFFAYVGQNPPSYNHSIILGFSFFCDT